MEKDTLHLCQCGHGPKNEYVGCEKCGKFTHSEYVIKAEEEKAKLIKKGEISFARMIESCIYCREEKRNNGVELKNNGKLSRSGTVNA